MYSSCPNSFAMRNHVFHIIFYSLLASVSTFPVLPRLPSSSLTTQLSASSYKLWDRLETEPDEEPQWYLINCVATMELDLLAQCRQACNDLEQPTKFVVPVERHTRSHGAKKIVTENKVKYPGYVFAYLALCAEVYERIQPLDLCRSWMGTINQKGHRKLPPLPTPLNEMEVEKFGLNDIEEVDLDVLDSTAEMSSDDGGVILDDDEIDTENEGYDGVVTQGVDTEALKQYLGLKVEDMVKVTAEGKLYGDDGVVRRLKGGKLMVRFYTYGKMYEEWLQPNEVRKLSGDEILRGMSMQRKPITQEAFDNPNGRNDGRYNSDRGGFNDRGYNSDRRGFNDRGGFNDQRGGGGRNQYQQDRRGGPRSNTYQSFGGNYNNRNRRQDRIANRFQQQDREDTGEENWQWYKDQRDNYERNGNGRGRWNQQEQFNGQDRRNRGRDNQYQDRDSQFRGRGDRQNSFGNRGRNQNSFGNRGGFQDSYGQSTGNRPRFQHNFDQDWENSDRSNFEDGGWNSQRQSRRDSNNRARNNVDNRRNEAAINGEDEWDSYVSKPDHSTDKDDFFSSLITELENDLGQPSSGSTNSKQNPNSSNPPDATGPSSKEDDFFATLLSELEETNNNGENGSSKHIEIRQDDDFFASLGSDGNSEASTATKSKTSGYGSIDDDFFGSMEGNLEAVLSSDVAATIANEPDRIVEEQLEGSWSTSPVDSINDSKPESPKSTPKSQKQEGSPMNEDDLTSTTVPVLKDMLRERGLRVGGKKAELIERLMQSQD